MADDKNSLHKGYVHYIPAVEEKDDWDKDLTFVLIRSLDELLVHDVEHDFTAWDTETSGLDPDMDYLVGFSFSFDGETGYYVPVGHDDMALGTEAVEIFYSILKKTRKTQFLFNCRFDQRFLEAALKHKGWTLDGMPYYDVQNAIWLADTNVVMPSLKASTRHFLGWKPKTFDETLGDAVTFQHVPAEDAYFYACTDALMTYQLALVSNKFYRENLPASRFDNNMLYPLMRLENTPQRLDTEYLKSLVPQVESIIDRTREEVYRLAGTQFNLNAPQQFGKILVERFGVDTKARTATGAMKADLKTIDAWMVKHSSVIGQDIKDFIKAYKEYKKTVKFKSSYLDKYIKAASEQDIYPVRFSYKTNSVPCLTENNVVLLKNKGIVSIKDVKENDEIWTQYGFKKVLWNNSHEVDSVYRLTLKNGSFIEGTEHHPILLNHGSSKKPKFQWCAIRDVHENEHIVVNHHSVEDWETDVCDPEFARLLGCLDGDGCVCLKDRIKIAYFSEESVEMMDYYASLMKRYFGLDAHTEKGKDRCITQCYFSTCVAEKLRSLGVRGDGVPQIVKTASPKVWLYYLSGLFDTDGNVSCAKSEKRKKVLSDFSVRVTCNGCVREYPSLKIACEKEGASEGTVGFILRGDSRYTNPDSKGRLWERIPLFGDKFYTPQVGVKLIKRQTVLDVFYMLSYFGIPSTFREVTSNQQTHHTQYYCRVRTQQGLVLFKSLIGDLMVSKKRVWLDQYPLDTFVEYADTRPVSCELTERKTTVYDIEVEDVHEYVANGIVTHNTGRLSCGTSAKNKFFTNNNVQSTPKPHAVLLKGRKATEQEIAEKRDILGWYFSNEIPDEEAKGLVEGMDPDNLNIRRAFLPENDQCYVVSIDMCLEGGSPVQTKRGYMGICEMNPGDEVWSPQGWVPVSRVMRTGVEKVIKVFPDNGGQAIYCTENHPFVINGEKVKAKDIKGKVPSVPFHAYVQSKHEIEELEKALKPVLCAPTLKQKIECVENNGLKQTIIDAVPKYTRASLLRMCGLDIHCTQFLSYFTPLPETHVRPKNMVTWNNVFVGESTPTSAYLFGFILGDGNICRRRGDYLTLNISSKDEAHLRQICNIFGEDLNIRHNEKKGCEWWTLDIPSRDICNRLLELGISERKSTEPSNVNFEWLGDNFRHFIRGLFDADGCVRITSVLDFSFVGHDSYITEIKKRLEGQWGYKHTPSLSYLSLHGTVAQKKFIYAYLYQEATIWLQRKRDIIESWYQDKFGDLVFPVWNCTVDTTEHQLYVQCAKVQQCAEELRVVANLYHEDTWINAFNSGADVHKACYSPDTEFYVKSQGWMYAENITPDMDIAYYDVRSDSFKFTKANKRATQKGRDVYVRSGVFNVTGNHRMYVNFDTQGYHIERADNLKNCGNAKQRFRMKTAVGTRVEFLKERNKDNATAFALGFLSSIDKEFDGTRMIVKCSTLYPDILQILKDYACNSTNKTLFEFSDKGVSCLERLGFSTSLGRVVDDAQIFSSRNSYRGFICGLLHGLACRKDSDIYLGDGSDLHGRTYVKDKALADWIQWHLTCNGYSCRVHHNVLSDRYALYIESRQGKDVCMTFHSVTGHSLTNGGIYSCFEVPSGLLVTRYDGRITVNGNTAIKLFGEENYTKDARKKAKCASFGILYGSGAQGFNQSFPDMTLDECREFMKKFKDALPAISQGQAENVAYARQHGDINTGFGRHRRVKFWLSSPDRAKQAFGERTVKNCYSPDTEYMTKDGWKVAADIEPTTQLAYYDPDTGVIRYCDAGIRYTHVCTESMRFSSRTADWDVTTNHRMWIRSTSHDRWRPCEAGSLENLTVWQEICSADLCSSLVETSDIQTPLGTFSRMHLARLFAWVLTDSTITEKEHYIICTQNKPQNFSVIEEIFSKFGAKVTIRNCVQASSGKEMRAYLAKPEFCEWVLEQIGGRLKPERHVPAWIFTSSKEVREEFLRHLVLADGTTVKDSKKQGCTFYSANKSFVDDVQILFTMTGFRASLQTYHNANGTEVYRLNCVKTSVRSMDNRIRKSGNKQLTRVKHEPIEYSCFSVPTQILVTRHHGKVTFGMNTSVQGTAADVLKIIFCRLWEKVFKPYPQVKFMSTIHDEVNFSIPIELAREVIPVCIKCMTIEREDWPVPLKCSLSLSRTDLGSLIPFTYDAATDTYEPEWDTLEVKPKVTHVVEATVDDTEDENNFDGCVCGVSVDEIDF